MSIEYGQQKRGGGSGANIPIGARFYEKRAKKTKSGSPNSRLLRTYIIYNIYSFNIATLNFPGYNPDFPLFFAQKNPSQVRLILDY